MITNIVWKPIHDYPENDITGCHKLTISEAIIDSANCFITHVIEIFILVKILYYSFGEKR
jgi:hypothetical protein